MVTQGGAFEITRAPAIELGLLDQFAPPVDGTIYIITLMQQRRMPSCDRNDFYTLDDTAYLRGDVFIDPANKHLEAGGWPCAVNVVYTLRRAFLKRMPAPNAERMVADLLAADASRLPLMYATEWNHLYPDGGEAVFIHHIDTDALTRDERNLGTWLCHADVSVLPVLPSSIDRVCKYTEYYVPKQRMLEIFDPNDPETPRRFNTSTVVFGYIPPGEAVLGGVDANMLIITDHSAPWMYFGQPNMLLYRTACSGALTTAQSHAVLMMPSVFGTTVYPKDEVMLKKCVPVSSL